MCLVLGLIDMRLLLYYRKPHLPFMYPEQFEEYYQDVKPPIYPNVIL